MATRLQIESLLDIIEKSHPHKAFINFEKNNTGIFAVIKYLKMKENPVKSVAISNALHISSARMAILLQKLEKKEYIIKVPDPLDARAVLILLSDKGNTAANAIKSYIFNISNDIIDTFGAKKAEKLFNDINIIKDIVHKNTEQNIFEEE